MNNKQFHEMTNEEILRQQLELLAERSANEASIEDLPHLTLAMIEIHKFLPNEKNLKLTSKELFLEASNALRKEQ